MIRKGIIFVCQYFLYSDGTLTQEQCLSSIWNRCTYATKPGNTSPSAAVKANLVNSTVSYNVIRVDFIVHETICRALFSSLSPWIVFPPDPAKTAFEEVFRDFESRIIIKLGHRNAACNSYIDNSLHARRGTPERKNPRRRSLSDATVAVPQPPSSLLFGRRRYFVSQDISRGYKSLRSRKSYRKILRYPHFHVYNVCSCTLLLAAHSSTFEIIRIQPSADHIFNTHNLELSYARSMYCSSL